MKDEKYQQQTIKKFKRNFTESEALQITLKKLFEKEMEVGILKSEIDELTHEVNTLKPLVKSYQNTLSERKEEDNKIRKQTIKESLYLKLDKKRKDLETTVSRLRNDNRNLIAKLSSYENKQYE